MDRKYIFKMETESLRLMLTKYEQNKVIYNSIIPHCSAMCHYLVKQHCIKTYVTI